MEVLVSLTLFALLFSVLGFWQRHMFVSSKRDERSYKNFLQENSAYRKLRTIFRFTSQIDEGIPGALYSVIFDRGVYRDPELAGEVAASLFYKEDQGKLELHIRSLKNQDKTETLLLLDHVSRVICVPQRNTGDLPERMLMKIHRKAPNNPEHILTYQFAVGK